MHLIALVDIPSTVSAITRGSEFHELNLDTANTYLKLGMARKKYPDIVDAPPVVKSITPIGVADFNGVVAPLTANTKAPVNARDWSGLFWDGNTVVILASGESLTMEQCALVQAWRDVDREQRKVIAINTTFRRAPWADLLYVCDIEWFNAKERGADKTYFEEANDYFPLARMWTQDQRAVSKYGVQYVASANNPGLSKKPGIVNTGNNSGYQALNLAYIAGATKIILLGYDMKGTHWHGDHPAPINSRLPFEMWIPAFQRMARDFKDTNCEVINATPESLLKGFRKVPLEEALS